MLLLCTLDVTQSVNQDHIVPYRNSLSATRLLSGNSSRRGGSPLAAVAAVEYKQLTASPFEW